MSVSLSRADRIVRGVLFHFAGLPKAVGPEWPRLYWSLLDRLGEFHAADDADARERIALVLLDLVLQRVPFATESWLTGSLPDPSGEPLRGPVDCFQPGFLSELLRLLRPYRFHGEVELTHPRVVRIGSRALTSLAFVPAGVGKEAGKALELQESIPIQVRAWGERIFLSPFEQTIHLNRNSLPCQLTFEIAGLTPGPGLLVIEIRQERQLIKVLHGRIQIEESPSVKGSQVSGRFPFEAGGRPAPRPDALIQFNLARKSRRFRISLEFDNSRGLVTQAERRLESDPIVYWRSLRSELERLPTGDPLRELERIGRHLYQECWPAALIPAMEELLASDARTLQVCSSHPWLIPWELLRPYDLSGSSAVQESFLCERFDIALWHFSETAIRPSPELRLAHVTCVFDRTVKNLPYLDSEREAIRREAERRGLRLSSVSPADRGNVLRSLKERADVPVDAWHFGGHGDHAFKKPDAAPLFLEKGTSIQPRDLAGAEPRLRAERPLVFLNVCRVGHGGAGLTSTAGGWPGRLVGNCGVGAVLAPLWAIRDDAAASFAQAFYERLPHESDLQQMTIAELVGSIRKAVRRPGDSTWLAYSLFADPNAKITAGP